MAYIGNRPVSGDNNSFRVLDDIKTHTFSFDGSSSSVVSTSDNTITHKGHRLIQGQRVTYTDGTGSPIGGLADGTVYFVVINDANSFKLASSASNASAGTGINLTSVGSGTAHNITVAFDGVNTKFKATYNDGTEADVTRVAQIQISLNNVIQEPQNTATPTSGFGFDTDSVIVFATAPASNATFWGVLFANNFPTFEISDNDVDSFTGNGSATQFSLSKSPASNENIIVTIDGVVQYPSDNSTTRAYNTIGNALQFSAAPANGADIQARHIGFAGPDPSVAGVTAFYGRTGSVFLNSSDSIVVNDAEVTGNLTVQGDTTTLNTTLRNVELLRVDGNDTVAAGIITQTGSGDILNLYDGSTEVFTVEDGGNVGIKTDNPGSLLHLQGTGGSTSGLTFKNSAGKNVTFYLTSDTSSSNFAVNYGGTGGSDIQIQPDGDVVLAPNGTGNVGIGTYTAESRLHVDGDTKLDTLNVTGITTLTGQVGFGTHITLPDHAKLKVGTHEDIEIYNKGNLSIIANKASGANSNNNALHIHSFYDLHQSSTFSQYFKVGNSLGAENHTGGDAALTLKSGGPVDAYYDGTIRFSTSGVGVTVYNQLDTTNIYATGITTFTGNIIANSDVGIGTDSPATKLHLFAETGDCVLTLEADRGNSNSNENDNPYIVFRQDGSVQNSAIGMNPNGITNESNALVLANGAGSAGIIFKTGSSGSFTSGTSEKMRITPDGVIRIADGGKITINTSVSGNYALQEALRIDDGNSTADRAFQIFEYHHNGSRWFSLNQNLHVTTTGTSYTYTQGNYGGSNMIQMISGDLRIFNNPEVVGGGTSAITPTERVSILADGRIGINDSSPANYELDIRKRSTVDDAQIRLYNDGTGNTQHTIMRYLVAGTAASNYIYFGDGNDSNAGQIRYQHGNDSLQFYVNADERLRIKSNGYVGIGTDNPQQQFTVYSGSAGRPTFRHSGGFGGVQIAGPQNASGASLMFTRGYDVVGGGTTTYTLFLAGSTQSLHFISGDPSEYLTKTKLLLNSSGNIGINTSNPRQKLHLDNGYMFVRGDSAPQVRMNATVNDTSSKRFTFGLATHSNNFFNGAQALDGCVTAPSDGRLLLGVGVAAELFILNSGDISINRSNQLGNAKLSINKDADQEGIAIQLNQSSGITTSFTTFNSAGSQIFDLAHDTDTTPDLIFKIKGSGESAPVEKVRFKSNGASEFFGDIYLKYNYPRIYFQDSNHNSDYSLINDDGTFSVYDDTNAKHRFRIMSTGVIGINTTTGTNTVNIGGAAGLGLKFHNFTSGNSSYITVESGDKLQSNVGGSGYYTWVTGGSEKVRIASDGTVGIGTNNPQARLETYQSGTTGYLFRATADLTVGSRPYDLKPPSSNSLTEPFSWNTGNAHAFQVDGVEALRIDSSGKVGIGTANPQVRLNVVNPTTLAGTVSNRQEIARFEGNVANDGMLEFANVRISNGSDWETSAFRIQRRIDSTRMGYIDFGAGAGSGTGGNGRDIQFGAGDGTLMMHLDSAGEVGIGTDNPDAPLHVETAADKSTIAIFGSTDTSGGGDTYQALLIRNNVENYPALANGSSSDTLDLRSSGSVQITIDSNNNDSNRYFRVVSNGQGTGGTELIRIKEDGVALFGGLTSQSTGDTAKFAVQGGDSNIGIIKVHAGGGETDNDLSGISFSHGVDNQTARAKAAIALRCNASGNGRGDLCFYTDNAADNNEVSSADERLRINSDGNFGFGTAVDPGDTLRYLDVANFNTGNNAGSILRLLTRESDGTDSISADFVKYKSGGLVINNNEKLGTTGYISFGTANNNGSTTEALRITADRKVGINQSSPSAFLEVRTTSSLGGTAGDEQDIAEFGSNVGNDTKLIVQNVRLSDGNDWTTVGTRIQRRVDVTDHAYIDFGVAGGGNAGGTLEIGYGSRINARVEALGGVGIATVSSNDGVGQLRYMSGSTVPDNIVGGITVNVDSGDITGDIKIPRNGHIMAVTTFTDDAGTSYPQPSGAGLIYVDVGPSKKLSLITQNNVSGNLRTSDSMVTDITTLTNNNVTFMPGSTNGTIRIANRWTTSPTTNKVMIYLTFM